jgi:ubiquitin-protein ligase
MATAPSGKRILAEVGKLQAMASNNDPSAVKFILDKQPDASSTVILGRILPKSNIYNQKAFQIELKLPNDYPFKAPEVRFITPIYHPNVDDKGKICVEIINTAEGYKPTTPLSEIITAITNLIDNPNIDHALTPGKLN